MGELCLTDGRGGPACGVQEGLPYALLSTSQKPGDTLVGYTEGVTEAISPSGELYGEPRLFARLAGRTPASAQSVTESVLLDVREFVQGTSQSDDITLISVKRAMP